MAPKKATKDKEKEKDTPGKKISCLECRQAKVKCVFPSTTSNPVTSTSTSNSRQADQEDAEQEQDGSDEDEDQDGEDTSDNNKCQRCTKLDKDCQKSDHKRGRKSGKV